MVSWTEWLPRREEVRAVRPLVAFRMGTIRRRGVFRVAVWVLVLVVLAAAVLPAFVPGAGSGDGRALDLLVLMPTALAGFLLVTIVSGTASGGGRELLARDPASIHPISPTTDHLGALLLAPLNIAWVIQALGLLAINAYGLGSSPDILIAGQAVVLLWLAFATAAAQVVAWSLEAVRRLRRGIVVVRGLTVLALGGALALQFSGQLIDILDRVPTRAVQLAMLAGFSPRWWATMLVLIVLTATAVVLGSLPAHLAAKRVPRDEIDVETGTFPARRAPRSAFDGLVRLDRASVWRAVPMRRGLAVLAIGPGLVALLGDLQWSSMTILPGLVASGGALLFGVNAWCLDGRGGFWRESQPIEPGTVFDARTWVLAEFLLVASLVTVGLGAIRAGVPEPGEFTAIACTLLVVTLQVSAAAMRWSAARPHAVDLRSARATPAPPSVMVGYSTRLALSTTMTGLVFSALAQIGSSVLSILIAVAFLAWSGMRLMRTRREWVVPENRARITTTVAI